MYSTVEVYSVIVQTQEEEGTVEYIRSICSTLFVYIVLQMYVFT